MSYHSAYPRITRQLGHYGTANGFVPTTPWTFCTGMDTVRTAFRMQQRTSVLGRAAYQFAAVRTDEPEAWVAIGGSGGVGNSDTSWHYDELDLSQTSENDSYFWIRFGVETDMASDAGGQALYELIPTFERVGVFRGVSQIQVRMGATGKIFYQAVTPMLPGVTVSKVKAAFVQRMSSSDMGNLRYGLAYRLAQSDPTVPGDWTEVGSTKTADTSATRIITDQTVDTAPAGVEHQWVQFGVIYDLSSSGTAMADMSVAVATR